MEIDLHIPERSYFVKRANKVLFILNLARIQNILCIFLTHFRFIVASAELCESRSFIRNDTAKIISSIA